MMSLRLQELTRAMLTQFGYKVVTAIQRRRIGSLRAVREKIKIVLMDMMMPVMDGPTTIQALRKEQPGLQFIAISGLMQSDKLKGNER